MDCTFAIITVYTLAMCIVLISITFFFTVARVFKTWCWHSHHRIVITQGNTECNLFIYAWLHSFFPMQGSDTITLAMWRFRYKLRATRKFLLDFTLPLNQDKPNSFRTVVFNEDQPIFSVNKTSAYFTSLHLLPRQFDTLTFGKLCIQLTKFFEHLCR